MVLAVFLSALNLNAQIVTVLNFRIINAIEYIKKDSLFKTTIDTNCRKNPTLSFEDDTTGMPGLSTALLESLRELYFDSLRKQKILPIAMWYKNEDNYKRQYMNIDPSLKKQEHSSFYLGLIQMNETPDILGFNVLDADCIFTKYVKKTNTFYYYEIYLLFDKNNEVIDSYSKITSVHSDMIYQDAER